MPGRLFPKAFEGQAPQEFGIGANILKTRTFDLTNARDLEQIDVGGSCLWAIAATSLTANIDICINDQLRDPVTFRQGMFVRGIPFSRLFVSHAAQPAETITLFFAAEEDTKNIQIVNPSIGFTNVNVGTLTNDKSWWYHTGRSEAFIGSGKALAGALGITPQVQLWNPAASGKNLLCQAIQVLSNVGTAFALTLTDHNAALANAGELGNKYLNAGAGVGLIKTATAVLAGTDLCSFYRIVDIPYDLPFLYPIQVILIPEGRGLIVKPDVDRQNDLFAMFQWVEVDA